MWLCYDFQLAYYSTSKAKQFCNTKWTLYSRHCCDKLRLHLKWQSCSQGAQLVGVILGWLRRPKLATKLRFYVAQKKIGLRYEATAVKLLNIKKSSLILNSFTTNVVRVGTKKVVLCAFCVYLGTKNSRLIGFLR